MAIISRQLLQEHILERLVLTREAGIEEGVQRGIARGRQQGASAILILILQHLFPSIDSHLLGRVGSLPFDHLQEMAIALPTLPTLAALLQWLDAERSY
ncbi:MAG: DUF4351 domain-containing protein [Kaiparowitsia implicata GSE-PSE-MK54-09C]|jgi:hypothetical protein|nr:DUF4351 domain-containing protein [Kaiparowitsia implicata GSE-PSE-MK54-09C]